MPLPPVPHIPFIPQLLRTYPSRHSSPLHPCLSCPTLCLPLSWSCYLSPIPFLMLPPSFLTPLPLSHIPSSFSVLHHPLLLLPPRQVISTTILAVPPVVSVTWSSSKERTCVSLGRTSGILTASAQGRQPGLGLVSRVSVNQGCYSSTLYGHYIWYCLKQNACN